MSKTGFVIVGALLGVVSVSCWIGGVIGWQQRNLWPAWLSVPLGVGMGPTYLIGDLMTLADGSTQGLVALPQCLLGGLAGAVLGWTLAGVKR